TQQTTVYYSEGTYLSREGVQNSFAKHVGVAVSYGAFSGEMSAAYSTASSQDTVYAYSYYNYHNPIAILFLNDPIGCLTQDFLKRVNSLPSTVSADNLRPFIEFFEEFGAYYTFQITLGGNLKFYVSVSTDMKTYEREISNCVKASYNSL